MKKLLATLTLVGAAVVLSFAQPPHPPLPPRPPAPHVHRPPAPPLPPRPRVHRAPRPRYYHGRSRYHRHYNNGRHRGHYKRKHYYR